MPSAAGPQGFIPYKHASGIIRPAAQQPDGIASGYGTTIYGGTPITLDTGGTWVIGAGATDLGGIFSGCEYDPADGSGRRYSSMWLASATYIAGSMVMYYHRFDDPMQYYWVQSAATLAATSVGDQADASNITAGSTVTQMSQATLGTLVGAGVQGQFRIIELAADIDNAWGDSFVNVVVQPARSQFFSNKVAI